MMALKASEIVGRGLVGMHHLGLGTNSRGCIGAFKRGYFDQLRTPEKENPYQGRGNGFSAGFANFYGYGRGWALAGKTISDDVPKWIDDEPAWFGIR